MARFFCRIFTHNPRKYSLLFLAFVWLMGLIFGIYYSSFGGSSYFSLMRSAACSPVSIVGLLSVALLPFLFSAFAVYTRSNFLLWMLCFIKGCLFAFVSMGVFAAYGNAGWLVRLLMMFSDLLCLVFLWLCWIRCACTGFRNSLPAVAGCGCISAVIVGLDYLFVSPILAKLVEY